MAALNLKASPPTSAPPRRRALRVDDRRPPPPPTPPPTPARSWYSTRTARGAGSRTGCQNRPNSNDRTRACVYCCPRPRRPPRGDFTPAQKPCSAPAPWSSTSRSARSTGVSPRRSPAPGRCSLKKRARRLRVLVRRVLLSALHDARCRLRAGRRGGPGGRGAARARARRDIGGGRSGRPRRSSAAQPTATSSSCAHGRRDSLATCGGEAPLDVRVAGVVEAGGRPASPLFLTQNHPATALLVACADPRPAGARVQCVPGGVRRRGAERGGDPGRVFPPCVFDRPHRVVGAAPAPCRVARPGASTARFVQGGGRRH